VTLAPVSSQVNVGVRAASFNTQAEDLSWSIEFGGDRVLKDGHPLRTIIGGFETATKKEIEEEDTGGKNHTEGTP
jgi:hypothetical protein